MRVNSSYWRKRHQEWRKKDSMDWRKAPEAEKYQLYLCSREWNEKRRAVHERAGGICERCHKKKINAVHHLTYIRKYRERLTDLQGLCFPCHDYVHNREKGIDVPDPIYDMDEEWEPKSLGTPPAKVVVCAICKQPGDLVGRTDSQFYCERCSADLEAAGRDKAEMDQILKTAIERQPYTMPLKPKGKTA